MLAAVDPDRRAIRQTLKRRRDEEPVAQVANEDEASLKRADARSNRRHERDAARSSSAPHSTR